MMMSFLSPLLRLWMGIVCGPYGLLGLGEVHPRLSTQHRDCFTQMTYSTIHRPHYLSKVAIASQGADP